MELKIEYLPIGELTPYLKNPRKNDKAVDIVARSIAEYGFLVPVVIDKDNIIVAGHTRVKSVPKAIILLNEMISKEEDENRRKILINRQNELISGIPTVKAENLKEEQIKGFRIMDNKANEYASWDPDTLQAELSELKSLGFDLELTGFKETEINKLLDTSIQEPNIGNKIPKYKIEYGDLYQLGENKIICGDSTKHEIIQKLFSPGEQISLVFTDPPYGVSYSGTNNPNGREWDVIEGDNLRGDELYNLIQVAFSIIEPLVVQRAALYVFHASRNQIIFEKALNQAGFKVKQQLIWHKHHILGHSHYHWCHEPIFYCSRLKEDPIFYGDRVDKTTINKMDVDKMTSEEMKDFLKELQKQSTLWMFKKDGTKDYIHPTQKPTGIAKRAILNSSQKGEIVYEPFAGSGSTLIACEESGRRCRAIEYDPAFCSHIIERWENLTGKKAVKL